MRCITYQKDEEARLAALLDDQVVDVQSAYLEYCHETRKPARLEYRFDSLLGWLAADEEGHRLVSEAIRSVTTASKQEEYRCSNILLDLHQLTILPPLPRPGKVICIGGNFPAAGKLTAPEYPIVFLKPSSSITGPGMPIWVSELTTSVAYEVELVAVVAKRARRLDIQQAEECIGGYTLANDVGDRVLEKRTSQWTSGKMFDTFTPLGPVLVTPDELPDLSSLPMETSVNGQQVQKGSTGDMFFGVGYLVSYISHLTTLEPGDIILTGSPKMIDGEPAPVVTLKPGDTVRVAIKGLGELTNPVQAEPE
jgi:acylpyruvate hydrolase